MPNQLTLCFPFPEPSRLPTRLVPFFLPFAGCPQRCIYCNQHLQTGSGSIELDRALKNLKELLSITQDPFSLGFFGGTFTGLDWSWQQQFLNIATQYRLKKQLEHLRISTRPDCLDPTIMNHLQAHGVDMIELGVQSFDPQTLAHSKRGYTSECALNACASVKTKGFQLGIQLLPGLPGHSLQKWRQDVLTTISLAPDVVRIYPCVVMANTGLERIYLDQAYSPWTLEQTILETGWALLNFWKANIRVIRLGLAAQENMLAKIIAGPWHPALGNMARAQALYLLLEKKLRTIVHTYRVMQVQMPQSLSGDIWGYKRSNIIKLAQIGITPACVKFWSKPDIVIELEK